MNKSNVMHCCTKYFLQKMVGGYSKKELSQLDTFLPLNPSSDVWREALPVTRITDSMYPFDDDGKRPTKAEVFNIDNV